ncbi:tellurite resistance/C4-dicarboxylate transporter family protein [Goodfellowiella coeruleoviolacea]|uniref:Tellurite resistance protein TehA n=1 Tax=Goodfellowiella coeruleoviolacea TaxID=334858 RepID=A0AAE3GJT7_9PSEU|nr:tellurite resistance/C4-dicarboxylate transporter family protein [Goodfellowiella coeruleoviolacea]MCP2167473.1 Tellurite resistance protein TehA [Goodfellowiella coeruleoviolacea]
MSGVAPAGIDAGTRPRFSVASTVRDLNPGAFAFVMGTGIVSTALRDDGAETASSWLLLIAAAGYVLLLGATGWRVLRWPGRVAEELRGPRAFAVLTLVPATNVLASNAAAVGWRWPAAALLAFGVLGWLGLGYAVPLGLVTAPDRRPAARDFTGTWFLWVVAAQSVAVAAATVSAWALPGPLAALTTVCWGLGLVLYLLLAALGLARLLVRPVLPGELVPAYWVFMGAAAITVLAGTKVAAVAAAARLLSPGLVLGLSVVLWSFCTWLVPLLVALGYWRHVRRRVPLRYETGLWSLVFPVGMYGVASHQLGRATGAGWLSALGGGEAWLALAVWVAVVVAMVAALTRHRR